MGRQTPRQALIKAARQEGDFTRVEIPRVRCPRCYQGAIYAQPDGSPRPHLRPAIQGADPQWSEIVPVRVNCEEQ